MSLDVYLQWAPMIAALAAVATLVWQINREIQASNRNEKEIRRAAKMKIISDLVALRFVLTSNRATTQTRQEDRVAFDQALSRIPIDFIDHEEVLLKYVDLGNSFTAEKFHDLINAMLEAAGHRVPDYFTVNLLENVPQVLPTAPNRRGAS